MDEERLGRLRVVVAATDTPADRRADHHRHRVLAAAPVAELGRFADDLVEGREDEIRELDFGDGAETVERHADRRADDAAFGERRVDHTVFTELVVEAGGDAEHAAHLADVLTEDDHVVVVAHLGAERVVHRLNQSHLGHRMISLASRRAAR